MTQYYIIELQQYQNGEYGNLTHFAYDEDATKARLKAESKYHEVLAAAAVSNLLCHSATLLTSDGRAVMNQCYRHEIESIPEEESTPEEDPVVEPTE